MQRLKKIFNKFLLIGKTFAFFFGVFFAVFFLAPEAQAVMCNDPASPALTCDCPSGTTIKRPRNHVVGPGGSVTIDPTIDIVDTPFPVCTCDSNANQTAQVGADICGICNSGEALDADGNCMSCPAGSSFNSDGNCVCNTDGATGVTTVQDVTDNCPACESPAAANSSTGLCECPTPVFEKSVSNGKVICGCPSGTTMETAVGGVGLTAQTYMCVCNVKDSNGQKRIKTANNTCPAPPVCEAPRALNTDGECLCPANSYQAGDNCICSSDQQTQVTTSVATDCPSQASNRCIYSASGTSTNVVLVHPKTPENWGAAMTSAQPRGICRDGAKCYRKSNTRPHGQGQCYPETTRKSVICERICGAGTTDCQIGNETNISVAWKTSGADVTTTESYKTVICPVGACPFPKVLSTASATPPANCQTPCGDPTRGKFFQGNACPVSFSACDDRIVCVFNGLVGHTNGFGTTCKYKAQRPALETTDLNNCACPVGATVNAGGDCVCNTDPENLPSYRGTIVKESPDSTASNPKEVGSVAACQTCPAGQEFVNGSCDYECGSDPSIPSSLHSLQKHLQTRETNTESANFGQCVCPAGFKMDSSTKQCVCDEPQNIKTENQPFLMWPRSTTTPTAPIEPADTHSHLCCPENCPPNAGGQCEGKWDKSKPIITNFVTQTCPAPCTCQDSNDASVTHNYICGDEKPSECGTCSRTCTDRGGNSVSYDCSADRPQACEPAVVVSDAFIPPTLGGIPSPIDAISVSSYNIHGAPAFTSIYSIGRADRPNYVCYKKVANNQKVWEPRYYCPDFRGSCVRGGQNCPCINNEGEEVSETFCEYADIEPLRNEGKSSVISVPGSNNNWKQTVSIKPLSVIVRTSPPR